VGKIRYYVVHGKNAVLKQERLRGIAQDKLREIYKLLKTEKQRQEFEDLLWQGDIDGKEFTRQELEQMGKDDAVIEAYLKQRRFHNQVWRLLKAHRKAYGYNVEGMEGIAGHVPHIFENWNVYATDQDGNPASILGTFRSLREAVLFANKLPPKQEYIVKPKVFRLPDEVIRKTILTDFSYAKLVDKIEKEFSLGRDEAMRIAGEIARHKSRHRYLGHLMKRKGQKGFRQDDMRAILSQYYNSVARYIALDDFKARVVPKFEKDFGVELGRAAQAQKDKNIARYVEEYINDLNGVPGMMEELMDATIRRYFGPQVRSQRPTIWLANKAIHATAVLKLGLFNLSAGFVNLTQLLNTFAKVDSKHFFWAAQKVLRGLDPAEKAILRRIGVGYYLGLADTGGYSMIHKGGKIVRASMLFFNKAERINRSITALAAYRQARKSLGMSEREARLYARKMIDITQFDYSVADTARIFRNPAGRLLGQFKPFAIKQIEFITGMKGAEHIKFWIPYLLLAAVGGIPLIEGIAEFIEWLTGRDPLLEYKKWLMEWAGDDPDKKRVARVAMYGLLSLLNIDISRRVGTGDALPKRPSDLLGPTINTLLQAKSILEKGDKTEFVRSLAPSVGNLITAIETAMNNMEVRDPYHRDRLKYEATTADVAAKALGLRPVRESELADAEKIRIYETKRYDRERHDVIDRIIMAIEKEDSEALAEAIEEAAEKGIAIDSKAIRDEIVRKVLSQEYRSFLATRRDLRPQQLKIFEYTQTNY